MVCDIAGAVKKAVVIPAVCHSERSEESSYTPPKPLTDSNWILRCAQNDKSVFGSAVGAVQSPEPGLAGAASWANCYKPKNPLTKSGT